MQDLPPVIEADNPSCDPSGSSSENFALNQKNYICTNLHSVGTSAATLNQTRRRLFHVLPVMQQATTSEQTKLEEEVANKIILEEQEDADVLRDAEAEVGGGAVNAIAVTTVLT